MALVANFAIDGYVIKNSGIISGTNGESIILPTRFAYPGLPHYLTSSLDPLLGKITPVVKQGSAPVKPSYPPYVRL